MTDSQPVYSTTTGKKSVFDALSSELQAELSLVPQEDDQYDPYYDESDYFNEWCYVCSRPTDHRGEHDDLVAEGLASYHPIDPVVYSR